MLRELLTNSFKKLFSIGSVFSFRKLLPLLLIKFFVSVNYQVLKLLKDTQIITSAGSSPEVIPVLKGWIILPASFIAAILYSKLSSRVSKRSLYNIVIWSFIGMVGLYSFILLPYQELFTPTSHCNTLLELTGGKFQHWIAVYQNWFHSLFYVTAELWGTVVIMLVFWGLANDLTSVEEAKSSYSLYIAAGDVACFGSGWGVGLLTKHLANETFLLTIQSMAIGFILISLAILYLYRWVYRNIDEAKAKLDIIVSHETKKKPGFIESTKRLLSSKYLLSIGVIVIAYGLTINLIEVSWEGILKQQYPIASDYQAFKADVTKYIGLFALMISLFLGNKIIRKLGWNFSAQITPVVVGFFGIILLFLCYLYQTNPPLLSSLLPLSPLLFLALFGAVQNILAKTVKYSFFDPTKEMAFIPLSEKEKTQGKAAIDVIGSRLGKSGSSWIQLALIDLVGTGSVLSISQFLIPIIVISVVSWSLSIKNLNSKISQSNYA